MRGWKGGRPNFPSVLQLTCGAHRLGLQTDRIGPNALGIELMFEQIRNFRDFGGLPTSDGGVVRSGVFYRSAELTLATINDCARLEEIGVRTVIDLRSSSEREERPNASGLPPTIEQVVREYAYSTADLARVASESSFQPEVLRNRMLNAYRNMHVNHVVSFRNLFNRLLTDRAPVLVHCAAGKDRTGCAAALVLSALGTPRDAILEDYLLTNNDMDETVRRFSAGHDNRDVRAADWGPLAQANADYLNAFFLELDSTAGGVERYLRDELGVDGASRDRLIQSYTER